MDAETGLARSAAGILALTEDAAKISGIAYIMDAHRAEAEAIINA